VKRMGGAGDGGRDIEARFVPDLVEDQWDLYQAKHYRGALSPTELFPDLAKVFVNLSTGTYPRPANYYICAPLNLGPDLHDLVAKPDEFKARFIADWKAGKTGLKPTRLNLNVSAMVKMFDFRRIKEFLAKDLINVHARNEAEHFKRFKIVPSRGDDPEKPAHPLGEEQVYIAELVRMYAESVGDPLTLTEVLDSDMFRDHFEGCRSEFYCAEGLKRFSRDIFPEEFDRLLQMIYAGIRTSLHHPSHKTGFARYDAVQERLGSVPTADSKLHPSMRGGDLLGTCHHLVNDKKFAWVK